MVSIEQIHPMLVHFPIVLFMAVLALDVTVAMRGGNLAARQGLAPVALAALVVGTLMAIAAAVFGDIALDRAVDLGFPEMPLERHEVLGITTLSLFGAFAALRLLAGWRGVALTGGRAWLVALLSFIGVGFVLATAAYGGYLVYDLGVNVIPVRP
jgi:uncharacterized membrane protein